MSTCTAVPLFRGYSASQRVSRGRVAVVVVLLLLAVYRQIKQQRAVLSSTPSIDAQVGTSRGPRRGIEPNTRGSGDIRNDMPRVGSAGELLWEESNQLQVTQVQHGIIVCTRQQTMYRECTWGLLRQSAA